MYAMGECGNPRCLQEKRYFRRELLSWYKKVPYAVGLELVAENLAGSASAHIKTLLLPFNDMEPAEPSDFDDDLTKPCIYCEGKEPEPDQESVVEPEIIPDQKAAKSEADFSLQQINSTAGLSWDMSDLEGFNSYYNKLAMTSLLYQQQQLQTAAVAAVQAAASSQHISSLNSSLASDGPLDLSAAQLTGTSVSQLVSQESCSELKVPEVRSKKKKDNGLKKSYTDKELNAAVEAIKSGVIGTRKAAQMYGVPRSTLRNKVFKSSEMSRQLPEAHSHSNAAGIVEEDNESINEVKSEGGSPQPRNRESTSPASQPKEQQIDNMSQYNVGFLKQLEEMRAKQCLSEQMTAATNSRFFAEMFNPLQLSAGYQFLMPQYPALPTLPGFDYLNPYASTMMMPYLPDLVKNLTQKRLEMEQQIQASQLASNRQVSPSVEPETQTKNKKDSEDIKVPSYKPSISGSVPDLPSHLEALKSVMHAGGSAASPFSVSYLQNLFPFQQSSQSSSNRKSPLETHPVRSKKFRHDDSSSTISHSHSAVANGSSSSNSSSGKKRPKRGQYRKYDSELLAQAVRAVQRGEMSVHRAGTFFGVPHSTLEYKVKERHLLRKKKIAESNEGKASPGPSKPPSAVSSHTVCSNSSDSYQSEKGATNLNETLTSDSPKKENNSNGSSSTNIFDFNAPYNNQSSDLTTPASELLKRLHERAHKKAAEILQANKTTQESPNSSSLVESLKN